MQSFDEVVNVLRRTFSVKDMPYPRTGPLHDLTSLEMGIEQDPSRRDLHELHFNIRTYALADYLVMTATPTLELDIVNQLELDTLDSTTPAYLSILAVMFEVAPKAKFTFRNTIIDRVTNRTAFGLDSAQLSEILRKSAGGGGLSVLSQKRQQARILQHVMIQNNNKSESIEGKTANLAAVRCQTRAIKRKFEEIQDENTELKAKLKKARSKLAKLRASGECEECSADGPRSMIVIGSDDPSTVCDAYLADIKPPKVACKYLGEEAVEEEDDDYMSD